MRRSSIVLTVCVLALLALGVSSTTIAQEGDRVAELEKKVATLEKRLANLEAQTNTRISQLTRQIQSAGQAKVNPLEGEAEQAFAAISRTVLAGDLESAKTQMGEFMKKYSSTNAAKRARTMNEELQVVGKAAPADWGITKWFQGENEIDLSSDKPTLLVFWETWCPHCQREVPKLEALYGKFKGEGLQVVGLTKVTRSATDEKVSAFITEQKLSYPVAKEDGKATGHFNVRGVPAAAVVKGGKVVWRGHPARLSEDMLKGWL